MNRTQEHRQVKYATLMQRMSLVKIRLKQSAHHLGMAIYVTDESRHDSFIAPLS